MHYLWQALIGLMVGALAKLIMPGKDPGGIIVTMLLGLAGSLVAGFLGQAVGWYKEGQSAGFIMSVLGAVLLLAIYRFFRSKTASAA
jgi:uncharacterized membrane protein YeaQ/YmgE (transglycosylase-associated protein family)